MEDAITVLINWLYTQTINIPANPADDHLDPLFSPHHSMCSDGCLSDVWLLAEELAIPRLQNEALRHIVKRHQYSKKVDTNWARYLYRTTTTESILHRLIIHLCVRYLSADEFDELPKELLGDCVVNMRGAIKDFADDDAYDIFEVPENVQAGEGSSL